VGIAIGAAAAMAKNLGKGSKPENKPAPKSEDSPDGEE
jgi:hypothetical protein